MRVGHETSGETRRQAQVVFVERIEPAREAAEDIDTARLVTRVQAGDADAFAPIYSRYFDRVYGYLRVVIKDRHEAEDTAQQVFLEALAALPRYELRGKPFRAWLFTIVRNQGVRYLRTQNRVEPWDEESINNRRERSGGNGDSSLDALSWIGDSDLLLFIERLPLAQRQVLLLRFMGGLSAGEIAEVLQCSAEAVRMQQSRALSFLRRRLTAVGRTPRHSGRESSRVIFRQARVVRLRRFSLMAPGPTG
ncbi:MAG: polymerase sigma-70 factor, subfamily [Solirubrobacterales bacterium]|jgi:RNA polymerase sigma-70 factor (ECF subfamily)|nr:polymerase sigma-70 factor, subfamily [Solirubrobacterales bacterium]